MAESSPKDRYDQMIKYAREYIDSQGYSSPASHPACRAAEIIYLAIRLSRGDVQLRLAVLSSRIGAELRPVARCFLKLYGDTPKAYQIRIRIHWICHAISANTDRKIESIAAEAGYSDMADFNHFFRKQTGMAPREYRNKVHNGSEPRTN